jgi:hypothetical protein
MPENLSETLTEIKMRNLNQAAFRALCRLTAVNLATIAILFIFDNFTGFSSGARIFLALCWAALNIGLTIKTARELLAAKLTDKQAAMELEKRFKIRDNSLVNAVCFKDDADMPEAMKKMFLSYANARCSKMTISGLWQNRGCRRIFWRSLILSGVSLLYFVPFHHYASNALQRFTKPQTQLAALNFTQFQVTPGNALVPEGADLKIMADAFRGGERRGSLKILIKGEGAPVLYPMDSQEGHGVFILKNVAADLAYSIQCGNESSGHFKVMVKRKPNFKRLTVTVNPPPYTRLKAEIYGAGIREIPALSGSAINIAAVPPDNMVCGFNISNSIRNARPPLSFKLEKNLSANAFIKGDDGTLYQDAWTCDFRVVNDRPPQVRFLNRETNIEAGFGQSIPLYFSAEDDFGIDRLAVTVSVNGRKATIKEFRYDFPPQNHVKETYQMRIIPGLFPPGGSAEINVVAADNHLPWQTGITPAPITIHVVDLVEKLKDSIGNDSKLYELLFQAINQQQSIRGRVSAQLKNFHRNEALQLSSDQKNIRNLLIKAEGEAARMVKKNSLRKDFAETLAAIKNGSAEELEKMAGDLARNGENNKSAVKVNEIVLVQTKLIEQLRKLLGAIAVLSPQEAKQQELAKDEAQEKEFYDKLQQVKSKLDEFIKDQRKIIKDTEALDPKKTDDWSDKEEKLLGNLASREAEWAQFFKAAFNDLSKKQNQDFSNSAMADEFVEMYEELQKAGDALKSKKNIEIATLAEDTAAGNAQSIAANLERWLADKQDNIKWNAEEDGKMNDTKLTDLPAELTDIIGDLIEKEEDMGDDTQDSTNSFTWDTDAALGWGVMDGNIDSMQAKGITGNVMPNNNEVGGRSGEGRSGKSSGQFVEKEASGKGGRKTPLRLEQSSFEKGTVEDKSKDAQGGASGGGKQSGIGDDGLAGVTPEQDQNISQRLSGNQGELKQRTQVLLKKLSGHNLPTGDLREALEKMRQLEQGGINGGVDIRRIRNEMAAALRNARTALDSSIKSEEEKLKRRRHQAFTVKFEQQEKVPAGYEEYVGRYFKALASEADE